MEAKVAKWRAIAHTVWRMEHPKVASATIAFTEVMKSNHQLSTKVGGVLAKLLCTRLDGDELLERCKDL